MTGYADYMDMAIEVARIGVQKGNSPFGAILVSPGGLIFPGYNEVLETGDPTAHAEIVAIREAAKFLTNRDEPFLENFTIYSTALPCPMCFGAIHWSRIERIVYGLDIKEVKKYGFNELEIDYGKLEHKIEIRKYRFVRKIRDLFEEWYLNGRTY